MNVCVYVYLHSSGQNNLMYLNVMTNYKGDFALEIMANVRLTLSVCESILYSAHEACSGKNKSILSLKDRSL